MAWRPLAPMARSKLAIPPAVAAAVVPTNVLRAQGSSIISASGGNDPSAPTNPSSSLPPPTPPPPPSPAAASTRLWFVSAARTRERAESEQVRGKGNISSARAAIVRGGCVTMFPAFRVSQMSVSDSYVAFSCQPHVTYK